MKTRESPLVDLDEILKHVLSGGVKDPVLLKRIQERSQAAQKEVLQKHGELDVAVEIIRESRDL